MIIWHRIGQKIRHWFLVLIKAKSVGVRAVILNSKGEILLVKHTYREGWHTPGGGVNLGETPVDAIRREVFEETGLKIEGAPRVFSVYLNKWRQLDDYPILYVVREQRGTPCINDPSEILAVGWFDIKNLPADTTLKTKERIAEISGYQEISERW